MSADSLPSWFDPAAINKALSRTSAPDDKELQDILEKSLSLESLDLHEAVALMRVEDEEQVARLLDAADKVKQKVYGDRIVLTAPLHISNYCGSECLYCSNRRSNTTVQRKYMTPPEMRRAAQKLIEQGHKRVLLVSGQLPNADIEYLEAAVSVLYTVFDGVGEIRRVNLNVGPLKPEEYAVLKAADAGSVFIFQDTYHEPSYYAAHVGGPKSDYLARLNSLDVAMQAGVEDVGLGILLGLGPWQYDMLGLIMHTAHLTRVYDSGPRTISLHRLRPTPGGFFEAPYPLSDGQFLRTVAIMRLSVPYTGIVLNTKEPAGVWRDGCCAGCSQLLTGSAANPYDSWTGVPGEKTPFPLGEDCHVDEVVRFLLEEARHLPSFCTACPRLGRSGQEFLSMVQECGMKSQCGPNSMASFTEFLLNYATPQTRKMGEKLLEERLAALPEHDRGAAERLLNKVRAGLMDEFI